MSKEYKFTLGRQRVSADLLSGLTPTNVGNTRQWTGSSVERGKWYEVVFTQAINPVYSFAPLDAIGVGVFLPFAGLIGGLDIDTFGSRWFPGVDGDYRYENIALRDGELYFKASVGDFAGNPYTLSNEELYELDWNSPLNSDPKDWNIAKQSIERGDTDFTQVTKYIGSLTFVDDGYDYLLAQFELNGRDMKVPVKIERRDKNGIYRIIVEGEIYLDASTFNLSRGEVQVTIEATDAAVLLDKGKDIRVSPYTSFANARSVFSNLPISARSVNTHDVNGAYGVLRLFFPLYEFLNSIIVAMSDGRVELYSDFLTTWNDQVTNGGNWLMIFKGMPGLTSADTYIKSILTFSELYKALDGMFNLGIGFEVRDNIQTIRIEPKTYWQSLTPTIVTLDRINEIEVKFPKDIGFREIKIGYKHLLNTTSGSDSEDIFSYSTDNKNNENVLDKSNDFVVDSGWMHAIIIGMNTNVKTDIDNNWFFVLCEQDPGGVRTKITSAPGNYNGDFAKEVIFPTYFQTTFLNENARADEGLSGSGLLTYSRILKFQYPVTRAQFNALQLPSAQVSVSGAGLPVAVTGIALHVDRANESGLADFEVLAE